MIHHVTRILLILLLVPASAWAGSDMKAVTGMTVKIPIFDTGSIPRLVSADGAGNPLELGTTVNVLVRCGTQDTVLIDSAALWVGDNTGLYTITLSAEDVINANAINEEMCDWSVVGIGSMAGLLDPSHILRKAIGYSMDQLLAPSVPGNTLDVANGRVVIDLDNTTGTLDAAEMGAVVGTAVVAGDCTATAIQFDTTLGATFTVADATRRMFLTWTSGALIHQTAAISAFATNGCVTVVGGFTAAPANGDAFFLVNR